MSAELRTKWTQRDVDEADDLEIAMCSSSNFRWHETLDGIPWAALKTIWRAEVASGDAGLRCDLCGGALACIGVVALVWSGRRWRVCVKCNVEYEHRSGAREVRDWVAEVLPARLCPVSSIVQFELAGGSTFDLGLATRSIPWSPEEGPLTPSQVAERSLEIALRAAREGEVEKSS